MLDERYGSGYIYVLRLPCGDYKIGRTANPEERFRAHRWELARSEPVVVILLIEVENQSKAETLFQRMFHQRRSSDRHNGYGPCKEWFSLSPSDLSKLCSWAEIIGRHVLYLDLTLNDDDWLLQLREAMNGTEILDQTVS